MKKFTIVLLTFITLIGFSTTSFAQKGSYYLTNVNIVGKQMVDYQYKNGNDIFIAIFKTVGKYSTLEITKNKEHYFSILRGKNGQPVYRIGKKNEMIGFNKKSYKLLPQEIKFILAYLEADEREYHPQFNGEGEIGLNNGIPDKLGEDIDAAADGGDGDCSQSSSCACANGQIITVTCGCNYAITCDIRSAEICTTDANGLNPDCRTVERCVGRCAALVD